MKNCKLIFHKFYNYLPGRLNVMILIMSLFFMIFFSGCQKDKEFNLRVVTNPSNGGSVDLTPSGGMYPEGTTVSLKPTPAQGFMFSSWSGTDQSFIQSDKIIMSKNMDITCNFAPSIEIRLKASDYQINGVVVNFLVISQTINFLNYTWAQIQSFTVSQAEWSLLGGVCPFETPYKTISLRPGLSYYLLTSNDITVVGSFNLKEGKTTFWLNYDYVTGRSKSSITQP